MPKLTNSFATLKTKHQVGSKFLIVGIWNTIFGYGVFCLLDTFFDWVFTTRSIAYMCAMGLAQPLAIINAYIWHKYITFKSETKGKAIVAEFFRFSATYAVTVFLSLFLLPIFVEIWKIQPKIAAAIIVFICTVVSYLGHSRFSFKKRINTTNGIKDNQGV